MRYRVFCAVILLILSLGMVGCRSVKKDLPYEGMEKTSDQKNRSKEEKKAYSVYDARDKKISFGEKPQRIASTNTYVDEVIMSLVDHKKIIGLSKWVHDPELAMGYEQAADIKGVVENNLEAVISLKPDLLFVQDTTSRAYITSLEEAGIKVYVFPYISRLKDIPYRIRKIGEAVGEPEKAEKLIESMNNKIAVVRKKVAALKPSQRKTGLLFLRFGAIGGKGTIYNDIMATVGIKDCYGEARSSAKNYEGLSRGLSKEEVLKTNPDMFIIGSWSHGGRYKKASLQLEEMYSDPAYAGINAIKNRQIYIVPQGYVNCLSHYAGDSIEKLYEVLYERQGMENPA